MTKLPVRLFKNMFAKIEEKNEHALERRGSLDPTVRVQIKEKRITSLSTKHRIRATLRSALSENL